MEGGGPQNVKQCYTAKAQKITGHQGLKVDSLNRYTGPPRFKQDIEPEIRQVSLPIF